MTKPPMLVWGDPPPPLGSADRAERRWAYVIAQLKDRPGAWACVQRDERRKNLYAKRRRLLAVAERLAHPGRVEAVTRRTPSGEDYGLWARYLPPGAAP